MCGRLYPAVELSPSTLWI